MSAKSGPTAHIDLLGKTATDRVTGFTGVITSVSFDLFGCIQATVHPRVDKDGKTGDGHWFDIHRLDVSAAPRAMPAPPFTAVTFGATPASHAHGPAEKPVRK